MNCRSFRKRQADLFDVRPDPAAIADLLAHAAECSKCARDLSEARAVMARIAPDQRLHASSQIKERIMKSVTELDAMKSAARTVTDRRPRYYGKLVRVGALAAILLAGIIVAGRFTSRPSPAFTTLAQAAEFVKGARTMHISARMRTIPNDNFDCIDPNAPLIPVEMWKEFGNPPKVRVEKEGRQIVADGKATTLLIQSGVGALAAKFDGLAEGCFSSLAPLLHADTLFERESKATEDPDSDVRITTKTGADGREKTILTISAKAQGDFSESDYLKNKTIMESDNIRVYTFDSETSRCEGMQVYVRTEHGNVLVFETTGIEYDIPLDPSLFRLDVPKSAVWSNEPSGTVAAKDNSWMQPDEVAREFFESLGRSDWQKAKELGAAWIDSPKAREEFGGLKIISIGKPFKSGLYPGRFVPYEIRFKSGEVKKHNLAVRNDTPDHQWMYDGGF